MIECKYYRRRNLTKVMSHRGTILALEKKLKTGDDIFRKCIERVFRGDTK